jgi:hypothetical protein
MYAKRATLRTMRLIEPTTPCSLLKPMSILFGQAPQKHEEGDLAIFPVRFQFLAPRRQHFASNDAKKYVEWKIRSRVHE